MRNATVLEALVSSALARHAGTSSGCCKDADVKRLGQVLQSRQGEGGWHSRLYNAAAFTLVEVTLAMGIAAFCLIVIFGLIPIGLKSNQAAIQQTAANGILSVVAADLRATRPPTPSEITAKTPITSQQFVIPIPANPVTVSPAPILRYFSSDGQCTTDLAGSIRPDGTAYNPRMQTRYRLTIAFLPNGSTPTRTATFVNLQVTWPAAVDPATGRPEGSVQTFVALDRN